MGFKNKEIDAALKMFGTAQDRAMPHPLQHCGSDMMHSGGWNKMRSMNSPGTVGNDASYNKAESLRSPVKKNHVNSDAYNALEALNLAGNTLGGTNTKHPSANPFVTSTPSSSALPGVGSMNYGSFGSGSYTNPQATTSSNTNDVSNSINPYSFMDDENLNKDMGDHKNKFGFNKRNEASFIDRIKKADDEGRAGRAQRLRNKKAAYMDNQLKKEKRRKTRGENREKRRNKNNSITVTNNE